MNILIRIQSRLSRGQAGEILANLITDLMFMFNQYGIETDPFVVAAISSYQKQHAVEKFTAA